MPRSSQILSYVSDGPGPLTQADPVLGVLVAEPGAAELQAGLAPQHHALCLRLLRGQLRVRESGALSGQLCVAVNF